jgi:NTE family protein
MRLWPAATEHQEPSMIRHADADMPLGDKIARDYEEVALVLQGGGALGSYQAGVYEGLAEAGVHPSWVAGISIGALNTAIIAGNAPEKRVDALRGFWDTICQPTTPIPWWPAAFEAALFGASEVFQKSFSAWHAGRALFDGQNGFFKPRMPWPLVPWPLPTSQASYYDTSPLRSTLERFADFDRINSKETRVSVGAVHVETGNMQYFDNTRRELRPEHFMASGALPPGFPAVEIDGQHYWDGGLVSNTPLMEIFDSIPRRDTLVFQVDLWSAQGEAPVSMVDVENRAKDIQFSSRTRAATDSLRRAQLLRSLLRQVLAQVPEEQRQKDRWCKMAQQVSTAKRYNVVQLIYRDKPYESHFKDFQFGPETLRDHWKSGLLDIEKTLLHPHWFDLPENEAGFASRDVHAPSSSDRLGTMTPTEREAGL